MKKQQKPRNDLALNKKELYKVAQQLIEEKNFQLLKKYKLITLKDLEKSKHVSFLPGNMITPGGVWAHYKHMLKSGEAVLIIMQTKNGYVDIFYKYPTVQRFIYKKGSYLLDDSKKMFVRSHNVYAFFYHEMCSLPYKQEIDITQIQRVFKEEEVNVRTALNPLTLSEYLSSDVIKTAVAGNDALKGVIIIIITLIVMFIMNVISMIILIFK